MADSVGRPNHVKTAASSPEPSPHTRKVWDFGVRGFHWLLVVAVVTAGLTGFFGARNALDIHLIAGTAIAALVGFRVVWGVLGGGFARFSSFLFAPATIIAYARGLLRGTTRRYLGHNPLGGLMVFALLAVLTLIVVSGVIALGGQDKQGPLAFVTPFAVGWFVRGVHKLLALMLVGMVAAHLAGVLYESRHENENLTAAMLTGRKRDEPGVAAQTGQGSWRLASILLLLGGVGITAGTIGLTARPALGVPTGPLDGAYARECGACHMVYHPSLMPASSWQAILADLGHHFGEDASLDPAITEQLRTYLTANAAERWDTLPAVKFRQSIDPKDSVRIDATGFWRRIHHNIPDATFTNRLVGGRGNCSACHSDAAAARFAPQNIEIPEELQ